MKVILLMPQAHQLGGAERGLIQLLRHAGGGDLEWVVVFLHDGPMVATVRSAGARVLVIDTGRLRQLHRFAAAVRRVTRLIQDEQADVVLSWLTKAHLIGSLAARLAGVPALWYRRESCSNSWLGVVATIFPGQGVLTCSKAVARAQNRLRPRRRTRVVYPGVELDQFDHARLAAPEALRRRLGLPSDGPLIGIVGRLQRWKGMHVLVEAMVAVRRERPQARCVIVGDSYASEPDYPGYLAGRIAELGLGDSVILAGFQENVPEWMQAMDVVVHASEAEPLGRVVIEAMALGKPVIAGDAGGPPEIVTDGQDGLLVSYGDASGLAEAILRYLDDDGLRRRITLAARRRACEFSVERYAENVVTALRDFVADAVPVPSVDSRATAPSETEAVILEA